MFSCGSMAHKFTGKANNGKRVAGLQLFGRSTFCGSVNIRLWGYCVIGTASQTNFDLFFLSRNIYWIESQLCTINLYSCYSTQKLIKQSMTLSIISIVLKFGKHRCLDSISILSIIKICDDFVKT